MSSINASAGGEYNDVSDIGELDRDDDRELVVGLLKILLAAQHKGIRYLQKKIFKNSVLIKLRFKIWNGISGLK